MSKRAKSIYAGRLLFDMSKMICPPAMREQFARAKSSGYLSGAAKKPNRWGIARVDIDASTCLQSSSCQHDAAFWLVNGDMKRAHTSCAADLYIVAQLIGVKFDAKGERHLGEYGSRFATRKAAVEAALDALLLPASAAAKATTLDAAAKATTSGASTPSSSATATAAIGDASEPGVDNKKRKTTVPPVAAPKRRLAKAAPNQGEEESEAEEVKEK